MSQYNRALVEHLMPGVWDSYAAYGIRNPQSPDADMPKGYVNPKEGSKLFAHLADIRQAWRTAELSRIERESVLLRYGLDWTHEEIGNARGVRKQSAQEAVERGIGKIVAHLNGERYVDGYDSLDPIKAD